MNILGIIPARAGSKSIRHKNRARVQGKPLIHYTFRAAKESKKLKRVIVSTDDLVIARLAKRAGIEIPFMRPKQLARDRTSMMDVVRYTLKRLQDEEGYRVDIVVILQPTSPFRKGRHIDDAITLLKRTGADSVVSVVEVPHHYVPDCLMKLKGGRLRHYKKGAVLTRRQEKPVLYARNGPVVLAARWDKIRRTSNFFGKDCRPYMMDIRESLDIDDPYDLEMARLQMKYGRR